MKVKVKETFLVVGGPAVALIWWLLDFLKMDLTSKAILIFLFVKNMKIFVEDLNEGYKSTICKEIDPERWLTK